MKTIIFVLRYFKNGGLERHCLNLVNEFSKRGYHCKIAVTNGISDTQLFNFHDNVELIDLQQYNQRFAEDEEYRKYSKILQRRIKSLVRLRMIGRIIPQIKKKCSFRIYCLRMQLTLFLFLHNHASQTVIAFGSKPFDGVISLQKRYRLHTILSTMNAPEVEFSADNQFRTRTRQIRKAAAVIVQTKKIEEFYRRFSDHVYVIHNPLEPDLPPRYQGQRKKIIINFCRLSEQKNLELLIDAYNLLYNDHPDYRLAIYGNIISESEQQYKDKLCQKIRELGLTDMVEILPPAADIHDRAVDAAMFVSSSDYEGLSNSMLEAMAIGLPCVCTDCLGGSTAEVMEDGVNGLVVPTRDARAMYLAMKKMIENPDIAERCSVNAYKIREQLSTDTIVSHWLRVIEQSGEIQ